jgi:cell wall-associated NlpC family hydrolase
LKKLMCQKSKYIACILCMLAAMLVSSAMPVLADGADGSEISSSAGDTVLPAPVAINGVASATGMAELVVTGKEYTLRKGSAVIVCGLYGDRYVIQYRGRIFLFPTSSILVKLPDTVDTAQTDGSGDALQPFVWPSLEDVLRTAVVTEMQKHIGQPYVWGATGPNSFDCSGLTRYVYKVALGYLMPRTSYHQKNIDARITIDEAKPGDLLFFKYGPRGDTYGVNHTGMYIGNLQMIDAKGRAYGVVVDTLHEGSSLTWPVIVVSPIDEIMLRYPQIVLPAPSEPAAIAAPALVLPNPDGTPQTATLSPDVTIPPAYDDAVRTE